MTGGGTISWVEIFKWSGIGYNGERGWGMGMVGGHIGAGNDSWRIGLDELDSFSFLKNLKIRFICTQFVLNFLSYRFDAVESFHVKYEGSS